MKYVLISILIGSLMLVGCGGGNSNQSESNTEKPVSPVVKIKKVSGTIDKYQEFNANSVELLSADGMLFNAEISAQGQYSISDKIVFPYIVRVRQNEGGYIYAIPKSDNSTDILNLNKISNLLVLTISPNNTAENLWGLESSKRVELIKNSYQSASKKIDDSIAPILSNLKLVSIDALNQPYETSKPLIDNVLDNINIVVNKPIGNNAPIIAIAVAATPNNVTLWDSSLLTKNPILLTNVNHIVDFGKIEASAEKHYEDLKTSASTYDPKNIDQNKVALLTMQMQQELQKINPSIDKLYLLLKDLMIATAVPVGIVDEIIQNAQNGESIDKIAALIGQAYGRDLSKEIEKYKNMTVEVVSKNAINKTITVKVTMGGVPQLVTWSMSGQVFDSINMNQKDWSSCIYDVYDGKATGAIDPEYYIRNSIFKNKCNQDLNYISCIWVGGAVGKPYCKDIISKSVKANASTELYNITAGPLLESRVFFACPSPSVPMYIRDSDAFLFKYRCG